MAGTAMTETVDSVSIGGTAVTTKNEGGTPGSSGLNPNAAKKGRTTGNRISEWWSQNSGP